MEKRTAISKECSLEKDIEGKYMIIRLRVAGCLSLRGLGEKDRGSRSLAGGWAWCLTLSP